MLGYFLMKNSTRLIKLFEKLDATPEMLLWLHERPRNVIELVTLHPDWSCWAASQVSGIKIEERWSLVRHLVSDDHLFFAACNVQLPAELAFQLAAMIHKDVYRRMSARYIFGLTGEQVATLQKPFPLANRPQLKLDQARRIVEYESHKIRLRAWRKRKTEARHQAGNVRQIRKEAERKQIVSKWVDEQIRAGIENRHIWDERFGEPRK